MSMNVVSMEATSLGVTRAPPESVEAAGGKRLKSEPDWESMTPPWESKRIEDLQESELSMYFDYPLPLLFNTKRFVFKNKAMIEREKALAEYRELNRNLTHYDAIAPPPNLGLLGGVRPFPITDAYRPRFILLCNLALKKYNDDNQGTNFVFEDLVKSTFKLVNGYIFYITFQAKDSSNNATRTFQAQVWDKYPRDVEPVVLSCSMKST